MISTRGGNNHSPTRQMRVEFGIGELFFKLTRQLGECFFPPLSESFFALLIESYSSPITQSAHCTNAQQRHDFGKFFSDLASKNFELLTSLASTLKILIPPLSVRFYLLFETSVNIAKLFMHSCKCVDSFQNKCKNRACTVCSEFYLSSWIYC
jgi:hypothetical protein